MGYKLTEYHLKITRSEWEDNVHSSKLTRESMQLAIEIVNQISKQNKLENLSSSSPNMSKSWIFP